MKPLRDPTGQRVFRLLTAGGIVAVVSLVAVLLVIMGPVPPNTITMAVGAEDEAYRQFAERYRELLARHGVELHLATTHGAVENLQKLRDPKSGVSIALLQGGLSTAKESPDLLSLGTLFYEPVWIFQRGNAPRTAMEMLNARVSIGPEGSGSRKLALELMTAVGIDSTGKNFLDLTQQQAAAALQGGGLDIAVMVAPWESPDVRELLASESIRALSFPRADAHVALRPFLNKLVVPQGVANMAKNRPPRDLMLVAPKTSMVVRGDLHPALQYLLLQVASQVHSTPGIFQKSGQFPSAEPIDFPLSDEARQFYHTGVPFLQRYLPFWAAILAGRLLVILIPVIGVMFPLIRFVPTAYAWIVRRRIFALYGELKFLEAEMEARSSDAGVEDLLDRLERLEGRANHLRVPIMFSHFLYTLRAHIDLVRRRLSLLMRRDTP